MYGFAEIAGDCMPCIKECNVLCCTILCCLPLILQDIIDLTSGEDIHKFADLFMKVWLHHYRPLSMFYWCVGSMYRGTYMVKTLIAIRTIICNRYRYYSYAPHVL